MRPLATRHLTALAISAALTLGAAGPALADEHHPSSAADRAGHAPLPDPAALLAQAEALGELGSVAAPVSELVTAALEADSGRLSATEVEGFKAEIATAVDEAKTAASLPATSAASLPAAPTDVLSDTLGSVEKAVAALLATVTSGVGGLVPQVTSTLSSVVDLLLGTVLGGLPAPGASTAPALPVTAPELPAKPPAAVPELPVQPPPPAG
ncbi:hypothetical protein GCM10010275_05080 [Streptomyces litmocidini]|uniref:hypothetical protein n=1 Tax=Streptomyces litmocidini TaxID=67318 RepID=UPI00167D3406|nr:hypothetical protein [Streptomyces litmocidini]GGU73422.1 hypothetical protein GCM10010275_05080 [Streptomyces litmocidini]